MSVEKSILSSIPFVWKQTWELQLVQIGNCQMQGSRKMREKIQYKMWSDNGLAKEIQVHLFLHSGGNKTHVDTP
jgi:hypothetical protein